MKKTLYLKFILAYFIFGVFGFIIVTTFVPNMTKEHLIREANRTTGAVRELEGIIGVTGIRRMEAFDISNLGDTGIVAGMTVFQHGRPRKSDYRKFRIRTTDGQNDYGSMHEAVTRRFQHYVDGDPGFCPLPDLLLIDGGAEHASVAQAVLNGFGLQVPVFGMVKDDRHRTRALITPGGHEIGIAANPAVFAFIGTIQEETHRFSIDYQRRLRRESLSSELDQIPGVGEKRRNALLKAFRGVKAIRAASYEELCAAVPAGVARAVYDHYHPKGEPPCA